MGIRFYCSHCQSRLNVKDKQAGQPGQCPYCDAEVVVPLESTPRRKKRKRKKRNGVNGTISASSENTASLENMANGESQSVYFGGEIPNDSASVAHTNVAGSSNGSPTSINGDDDGGLQLQPISDQVSDNGARISGGKLPVPDIQEVVLGKNRIQDANFSSVDERNRRQVESPQVENDPASISYDEQSSATETIKNSVSSSVKVDELELPEMSDSKNSLEPPESSIEPSSDEGEQQLNGTQQDDSQVFNLAKPVLELNGQHPIREFPNKIWYVRGKRLGEKGPLKAVQIEDLLENGIVKKGCIVWREDWIDWQPAELVFPELEMSEAEKRAFTDPNYRIPDELNPHSELSRQRRFKKTFGLIAIGLSFVTIVILSYVLIRLLS